MEGKEKKYFDILYEKNMKLAKTILLEGLEIKLQLQAAKIRSLKSSR